MPRAEMLSRMSSKELTEWIVYHSIEPFGGVVPYIGHAITSATVANVNRGKGQKAYKLKDFMPDFEAKKEQSTEEMINIAAIYTASLGGKDLRGDDDG